MFGKKPSSKYKLDRSRSRKKPTAAAEESSEDESDFQMPSQEDDGVAPDDGSFHRDDDSSEEGPSQNPKHRITSPRKAVLDEDDEEENDDDSDNESETGKKLASSRKRPVKATPNNNKTRRGGRTAAKKNDIDDDDDVFEFKDSSSDDEEEEVPKSKRRSTRKPVAKKFAPPRRGRRSAARDDTSSEEEGGSSSDDEEVPTKRPTRRSRATTARKQTDLSDSSDDDDNEEQTPTRKSIRRKSAVATTPARQTARKARTGKKRAAMDQQDSLANLPSPKRSSAIKARRKVQTVSNIEEKGSDQDVDSDELVESESEEEPAPKRKTRGRGKSKRKASASSDEEFQVDPESEASRDSSLSDALDDEDDELVQNSDASYQEDDKTGDASEEDRKAVNIDDEQVGTADESSGDEEMFSSPKKPDGKKHEIRPSPHKGIFERSDSSDSDNDEVNIAKNIEAKPRLPPCPSTVDAITSEELPERHVCYISPDGQSRQCFKLETLRQIALQSTQLALRTKLDGSQTQNYLQPPHFRTPASDDLLDQIASRFGRDALDLQGAYFKEKEKKADDSYDEDSDSDEDEDVYALSTMQRNMQKYLANTMGHTDLYVCPLCYHQAHQNAHKFISKKDEDEKVASEYVFDPMDVLGTLDKQEFELAAQFCFRKVADVKKHVRSAHNIDPRSVQGNDFFARYKIRTPDGLLQRWLAHSFRASRQGSMREYWNEGNNQSFILLLDLVNRATHAQINEKLSGESDDESHEEKSVTDREKAEKFWDSFAADAQSLWDKLSEPFQRDQENMKSFIANDEDVEEASEGELVTHAAVHREWVNKADESDENDLAHKIQRQYAEGEDIPDDSDAGSQSSEELEIVHKAKYGSRSDSEDEEDEEALVNKRGYYSPVEEETDEWVLSRMDRKRKKSTTPSSKPPDSASSKEKAVVSATPVGKKIRRRSNSSASKTTPVAPIQLSATKRTPAIQDDSDEDD